MQKTYVKEGIKIVHPSGVEIIHTKTQLQGLISSNQKAIDDLANDNLRIQYDIEQIDLLNK